MSDRDRIIATLGIAAKPALFNLWNKAQRRMIEKIIKENEARKGTPRESQDSPNLAVCRSAAHAALDRLMSLKAAKKTPDLYAHADPIRSLDAQGTRLTVSNEEMNDPSRNGWALTTVEFVWVPAQKKVLYRVKARPSHPMVWKELPNNPASIADEVLKASGWERKASRKGSKHGMEGACWPGYEAIGTKTKDGKRVPNCVPSK